MCVVVGNELTNNRVSLSEKLLALKLQQQMRSYLHKGNVIQLNPLFIC